MCRKLPNMSPIAIRGMPISGAPSMSIVIAAVPTAPAATPRPRFSFDIAPPVLFVVSDSHPLACRSHAWLVLCQRLGLNRARAEAPPGAEHPQDPLVPI